MVISLAQVVAVVAACWWDNSLMLSAGHGFPHAGKGLFQHYGAWAILATDPLLLIASGFLDRQFCVAMLTLPLRPEKEVRSELVSTLRIWVSRIRGRRGANLAYGLFVIVGIYAWSQNVASTIDPMGAHRHPIFAYHDVFDSGIHPWSFIAFKACLFLSWVVVYPIVGFKFLTIAVATFAMLRRAEKRALLRPCVEHPDGCFGLKQVGTLNIAILAPFQLAFFVIFALLMTHQMLYGSIVIPMIALSGIFLVVSFLVIWPAQMSLWRARKKEYQDLARSTLEPPTADRDFLQFATRRLLFSAANASPYSDTTKVIIIAMRVAPLASVAVKLLR